MASRPPLTPIGSALAGALGAVFSNAIVYPLDTVKTRLQALPSSSLLSSEAIKEQSDKRIEHVHNLPRSLPRTLLRRIRQWPMLSLLLRILRTEGIAGAFKGFTASMISTFSMQFAYFFFHTLLRIAALRRLAKRSTLIPISLSTSSELILGALAGAFAQIFTIPVAVIATRQQLFIPPSSTPFKSPPSLLESARDIVAESGPTGLWTGLKPGLVLTVNPAITYGVFERLKTLTLGRTGKAKLTMGEAFWLGVGSKTLATVVTYPYIFAKVRLQASTLNIDPALSIEDPSAPVDATNYSGIKDRNQGSSGSSVVASNRQLRGAIPLLVAVYRERGFLGWYQGLTAQVIKAVLCQGILFVSKDQFEGYAWIIMGFLAELRGQINLK
ncbi:MAG: ADP/ATP carrier protein [Tremellales sp. Tagirdzhanova-0007]|nr:MAG: ADP/ATP carrier protein [Tremellales sp. Tagirdzhanova-0007]